MPRTAGCTCDEVVIANVGLVDSSECWLDVGGPSHELRFGLPWDGTTKDCPVEARDGRKSGLSGTEGEEAAGDGDDGWLSFFLKNFPKIFLVPLVGVELISERLMVGADGDELSMPAEESE